MGFKQYNVETIFKQRPMLVEYPLLPQSVKEVVDFTVKESLRPNSALRIRSLIPKTLMPKKSDLWYLPWSDIVELRVAVSEQNIYDVLRVVFGITEKQFLLLDLFNAFAAYKWIADEFQSIIEIEIQELASEPSEAEIDAGIEELQEFGYSVALDGLAKGDLLKYDDYLKLPYTKIFRKMCLDKKRYEINKNLQDAGRKNQTDS